MSTKYLINNVKTNWKSFIDNELKQPYMIQLDDKLSKCNEIIYPSKDQIFRAFDFFNIQDTRIVIFGQDPYHNPNQANGLSFSVYSDQTIPPSLRNIFKKLNLELGINRNNPDLTNWAEQGILLLNTILTVSKNKPLSHKDYGWDKFTVNVINELNKSNNPVLFLLMGNNAIELSKYISNKHVILKTCHPSPLAANKHGFFDNPLFIKIDDFMTMYYKKKINW